MNGGRLEQVGTPAEVYDPPANRFVAGFIGAPAMAFALPGVAPDAIVGVRPEFARPWTDGLLGPLEGRVEYDEALGREAFVGVRADTDTVLVVEVDGRARVQPGETFRFGLVEEGLRYFDPETGLAAP